MEKPEGDDHLEEILDNDSDTEPNFGSPAAKFPLKKASEACLRFRDLYQVKGILGHGQYGVVVLVLCLKSKHLRALKIVYKTRLSDEEQEILKQESEILQRISANQQRSNVVQSY